MGWRYILEALPSREIIDSNLPLSGAQVQETLSGPGAISGTLPIEFRHLQRPDGQPVLDEWGCAIAAEADGEIRGYGIVDSVVPSGPSLALDSVGFTGMLQGQPYTGNGAVWTRVDPFDVVRHVWDHWQGYPDGDLGVIVDGHSSPVRLGEEEYVPIWTEMAGSDTTFDEGPIRLNWWDVHDLGGFIDDLAKRGHFDYREETTWNAASDGFVHRLRLGYPTLGTRREDLRFVVGENIHVPPSREIGEEGYAGYAMVLGAGEGREKVYSGLIGEPTGRLRRVHVEVDDRIKRLSDAIDRARTERNKRLGMRSISDLIVRDHPNAPIGSWRVGDEIYVQGDAGWGNLDTWVRILGSTISPESGDAATLTVGLSR